MLLTIDGIANLSGVIKRLNSYITKGNITACWPWNGAKRKNGYGVLEINLHGKWRPVMVHRLIYLIEHKTIPDPPLIIRHLCGHSWCCNPNHLATGTVRDNAQDRIRHGTQWRGEKLSIATKLRTPRGDNHPLRKNPERAARGEKHWCAKLTTNQVYEIRKLHSEGVQIISLAALFKVSHHTIRLIIKRKTWRHI